jgi:hypothetical protein
LGTPGVQTSFAEYSSTQSIAMVLKFGLVVDVVLRLDSRALPVHCSRHYVHDHVLAVTISTHFLVVNRDQEILVDPKLSIGGFESYPVQRIQGISDTVPRNVVRVIAKQCYCKLGYLL